MAGYSAPSTGQVLTAHPRGWNDPPSYVFSPATNVSRKRIDPRKRVGHDFTSGSAINPVQQVPVLNGSVQPGGISGFIPPTPHVPTAISHSNSNPDLHNPANFMPPIHHANSVPNSLNDYAEPQGSENALHQRQQPPVNTSLAAPVQPSNIAFHNSPNNCMAHCTNDKNVDGRKLSAPSSKLDSSSIFSRLSTPTMLQSSHLANRTNIVERKAGEESRCVTNSEIVSPSSGFRSLSPVSNVSYNSAPQMSSLPHIPTSNPPVPYDAYSNNLSMPHRISPTNAMNSAPPINGFYAAKSSGKQSPKPISPQVNGHCSPVLMNEKLNSESDGELLNEIVDRLLTCRDKCSCVFTNKASEEINKKMVTFKSLWLSGKLSTAVKQQMCNLSEAIEKREFSQAELIHKSLIVSHSSEVVSWMVAVKKLISSYQKVVEENNKY